MRDLGFKSILLTRGLLLGYIKCYKVGQLKVGHSMNFVVLSVVAVLAVVMLNAVMLNVIMTWS